MWAPEVPMEAKNAMSSGGTAPAFSKSCLDLCAKSCTSWGLIVPQAHLSIKDVPSSDETNLAGSSSASLCLMPPCLLLFARGSPDMSMTEGTGTKLCTVKKTKIEQFHHGHVGGHSLLGSSNWKLTFTQQTQSNMPHENQKLLSTRSTHNQTCYMNTKNSWAQGLSHHTTNSCWEACKQLWTQKFSWEPKTIWAASCLALTQQMLLSVQMLPKLQILLRLQMLLRFKKWLR